MDHERPGNNSTPTQDPRLLIVDCMELFGLLEELVTERGGDGKGLGEKVHSLRTRLPEPLFAQLRSVVTIRNEITHQTHKQRFTATELRETAGLCRSIRDQLNALPNDYVRSRFSHQGRPWRGTRLAPNAFLGSPRPAQPHLRARLLALVVIGVVFLIFGQARSCQTSLSELTGPSASVGDAPSPGPREESARSLRRPLSGPAPSYANSATPRPAVSKYPTRHAKRTAKHDGDSWNEMVDAVESPPAPAPAPFGRAPTGTDPTVEEIDSVLGK